MSSFYKCFFIKAPVAPNNSAESAAACLLIRFIHTAGKTSINADPRGRRLANRADEDGVHDYGWSLILGWILLP